MATDLELFVLRLPKTTIEELKYYKEEFNINPASLIRKIVEVGCQDLEQKIENKQIILNKKNSLNNKYYATRLPKKHLAFVKSVAEKYNVKRTVVFRSIIKDGLEKFRIKIHQKQNEIPAAPRMGKRKP